MSERGRDGVSVSVCVEKVREKEGEREGETLYFFYNEYVHEMFAEKRV